MWPCLRNLFALKLRSCDWRNMMHVPCWGRTTCRHLRLGSFLQLYTALCTLKLDAFLLWSFCDTEAMGAPSPLCMCHYGVTTDTLTEEAGFNRQNFLFLTLGQVTWNISTVLQDGVTHRRNHSVMHICFTPFHISIPHALFLLPVMLSQTTYIYRSLPFGICLHGKPELRQTSILLKI